MSARPDQPISLKATCIGLLVGAAIAILFAATGRPGLMGVGAAIGASLAAALGHQDRG